LGLPKGVVEGGTEADIRWAIEQVIMKMLHEGVKHLLKYKVATEKIEVPDSFDDLEKLWRSDDSNN
jgi:DNA-binding FrmR family transcriptional regulator